MLQKARMEVSRSRKTSRSDEVEGQSLVRLMYQTNQFCICFKVEWYSGESRSGYAGEGQVLYKPIKYIKEMNI